MSDQSFKFKVAIATNSGETIDGHFGSCTCFAIYQFDVDKIEYLETRIATEVPGIEKSSARAIQLSDCHLLYVASIGGTATAKVIKAGIHPLKDQHQNEIVGVLERLQAVARSNPPPWMAKLMGQISPVANRLMAAGK